VSVGGWQPRGEGRRQAGGRGGSAPGGGVTGGAAGAGDATAAAGAAGALAPGAPGTERRLGPITFTRLQVVSFSHSCIYLALLIVAFGLGQPEPATFVLGMSHGVLWIVMSLVCAAAAKARVIPFWLAVDVAVLGGLGPFAGSIGFVLARRRGLGPARAARSPAALDA
jgi:hypothetical protein